MVFETIQFEYPMVILFILPIFLLLLILLKHNFITIDLDKEIKRKLKIHRLILLFTRTIIFTLLLVAITSPYSLEEKVVEGSPYLTIVDDNTTSYNLFPKHDNLIQELENEITVYRETINPKNYSAIGDTLIEASKTSDNILLISDGNNNKGGILSDVGLFLTSENITVHALAQEPKYNDVSISIDGPSETVPGVENIFTINLGKIKDSNVHILVYIDGRLKMETYTEKSRELFTHTFHEGTHEIIAKIDIPEEEENYFKENDAFFKTVTVINKPQVLFISEKESPLKRILDGLYEVTQTSRMPINVNELDKFYSVIVNDINADHITPTHVDTFEKYLNDGNGLVVIGGENSFDYGDYGSSYFETILPTQSGEGNPIDDSKQPTNIVVVIDISKGSHDNIEGVALEKAHAINIIKSLRSADKIGALAFNKDVSVVSSIVDYETNKDLITSKIQRLDYGGNSNLGPALIHASNMLSDFYGKNNIIVLSDGCTTDWKSLKGDENNLQSASEYAKSKGVRIFTLGVAQKRENFLHTGLCEDKLKLVAKIGGGTYDKVTKANNIKIEFGQEKDPDQEEMKKLTLSVRDRGHYITDSLELDDPEITGFNTIVPKSTAQTLITTIQGYPIVTTWRYGLGRVVSLSIDDGTRWGGYLLSKKNSKIFSRIFSYSVGSPKRKEKEYIEIPDTRSGEISKLYVKSESFPTYEGLDFTMTEPNLYESTFTPETAGINEMVGRSFAVNYEREYQDIGINSKLNSLLMDTGGSFFDPKDTETIIEFARSKAKKLVTQKEYYRWILLIIAIVVFLFELTVRRILTNSKKI